MIKIESEKKLEANLKIRVEKELKGWCIKMLSSHIAGLPDRLCLIPGGTIFFVELKTTKQKPRKIQLWVHNKLRLLGFRVYVIDTSEGITDLINIYKHDD